MKISQEYKGSYSAAIIRLDGKPVIALGINREDLDDNITRYSNKNAKEVEVERRYDGINPTAVPLLHYAVKKIEGRDVIDLENILA